MLSTPLIITSAIFFPGLIDKTKAILSGRKGPKIIQPMYDIIRLFQKGNVYSTATGFIFQIAIPIYFAGIIVAMLLLPFGGQAGFFSFQGDFVLFSYLLALGRFLMILAALDVASGFEGMGANREALYSILVEPIFFVTLGTLALFSGFSSFIEIFDHISHNKVDAILISLLAVYILGQVALIENCRLPIDDPTTHLELTMIHEVMILDTSGFDLALVQTANALKFTIYGTLIANLLIPGSWSWWLQIPIFFVIQFFFAISIAVLESFRARKKMAQNPQYLLTLLSIAFMLFFAVMIIKNNI